MHKPKPLRANLSKELRELIMHMLAKKPKNRPTAREIADMLPCKIAVRPPMQRSLQPRVGRCMGIGGAALGRRVQLKTVDSTICAQLDTQVRAHRIWRGAGALRKHLVQRLCVCAQPETLIAKLQALLSQYEARPAMA